MEAREGQFRSVHVLRHTFRPSEALSGQLREMVVTQKGATSPSFILTSTREVAVDALDFQNYRYDLAIHALQRQFQHHAGGVALQSVAYKFTPRGDLKLRFTPANQAEFTALTDPIDSLNDIIGQSERGGRYFIHMHLDASRLVARAALANAWHQLRENMAAPTVARLYTALPYDISGPERTVVAAPPVYSYDALSTVDYDGLI